MVGCGTRVAGKTKHEVTGDVTVKVILEVPSCDVIEDDEERAECLKAFTKALSKQPNQNNKH
jgi:hypothetical protein